MNVVFAYTRAQALEDGVLIDVTTVAREAGFRFPVAVTAAVWGAYIAVPANVPGQDEAGRLWDILWMLKYSIRNSAGGSEIQFIVLVRNDEREPQPVTLKSVCGAGDNGEPVITVMLTDED